MGGKGNCSEKWFCCVPLNELIESLLWPCNKRCLLCFRLWSLSLCLWCLWRRCRSSFLRRTRQRHARTRTAMAAAAPIVPPTIAPTFLWSLPESVDEFCKDELSPATLAIGVELGELV